MSEFEEAVALAKRVTAHAWRDPDVDASFVLLAREFLALVSREDQERIAALTTVEAVYCVQQSMPKEVK